MRSGGGRLFASSNPRKRTGAAIARQQGGLFTSPPDERAQTMLMRVPRAAICAVAIFSIVSPAYGLTGQEIVAKLEAAGYSQIREMTAGKIMTHKAVRGGKEVSLVVDSFGKVKELP
jgi:hypothetical protein